jgi:ribosomal protein RSM22 (predicted rRNA methylase)
MELPPDLDLAFRRVLEDIPANRLTQAVDRLIAAYRGEGDAPLLDSREAAVAYAAYRMPATYAAVRSALGEFAAQAPQFAPRTYVDVGGGTGAAAWAVADLWPDVDEVTVLDRSQRALDLGRDLAATSPVLARAQWRTQAAGPDLTLPDADLVTLSYVLGELPPQTQTHVVQEAAAHARTVAVVEPGTPAGYLRIREARDHLITAGLSVAAPCPHNGTCPIAPAHDWCHFATRLTRTPLHRRLKGGSLGYEDEKSAYVIATRDPASQAPSRILRHPLHRKGMTTLTLCTEHDGLQTTILTKKRHGPLYRAARNTSWGEPWPPPGE